MKEVTEMKEKLEQHQMSKSNKTKYRLHRRQINLLEVLNKVNGLMNKVKDHPDLRTRQEKER